MNVVVATIEGLSCVKPVFAIEASSPRVQIFADPHTLVRTRDAVEVCWLNLSCRLRLRQITVTYKRGHGEMTWTWTKWVTLTGADNVGIKPEGWASDVGSSGSASAGVALYLKYSSGKVQWCKKLPLLNEGSIKDP